MNNLLHETIANIAYVVGGNRYYSEGTCADMQHLIYLANEFEKKYEGVVWDDFKIDYEEAIKLFIEDNLKLRDPVDFCPVAATTPWDTIEIKAMYDDGDHVTSVQPLESTDYFVKYYSLYLHQIDCGVACIADVPTEKHAEDLKLLIETSVRTFMKTDNSEFVELKPRLLKKLDVLHRSHYSDIYKKAIEDVKQFITNQKLP